MAQVAGPPRDPFGPAHARRGRAPPLPAAPLVPSAPRFVRRWWS